MTRGWVITIRKVRMGWMVEGYWCPTRKTRDRRVARERKRTGKTQVRTPG